MVEMVEMVEMDVMIEMVELIAKFNIICRFECLLYTNFTSTESIIFKVYVQLSASNFRLIFADFGLMT